MATAFLLVKADGSYNPPKPLSCVICSEGTPTTMNNIVYIKVTECSAEHYHEAYYTLLGRIQHDPDLAWALAGLDEV